MIQDIAPHVFDNSFSKVAIDEEDYVLIYSKNGVLLRFDHDRIHYPHFYDLKSAGLETAVNKYAEFLFFIDKKRYFLLDTERIGEFGDYHYVNQGDLRLLLPEWRAFAGAVGKQLERWRQNHKYCGRCASHMQNSESERALVCSNCGNTVYPTISPCVIVAVTDKNRILLTKYAGRGYKKYALVAGYNEIGESLEETVKREVMEEVGLKVKNIRYYKSQPWPFTDTLLSGFFAELDGDDRITLQEDELSEGVWFDRAEVQKPDELISLTNDMIECFRLGKEREATATND